MPASIKPVTGDRKGQLTGLISVLNAVFAGYSALKSVYIKTMMDILKLTFIIVMDVVFVPGNVQLVSSLWLRRRNNGDHSRTGSIGSYW